MGISDTRRRVSMPGEAPETFAGKLRPDTCPPQVRALLAGSICRGPPDDPKRVAGCSVALPVQSVMQHVAPRSVAGDQPDGRPPSSNDIPGNDIPGNVIARRN